MVPGEADMNLLDISLNFYIIFFLIIWFEGDVTNFFNTIGIGRKLFKRPNFEKYKIEIDVTSTYPDFLYNEYPSFITKLISCPICLTFWLTLIVNIGVLSNINGFLYSSLTFSIYYFINLLCYLLIRKLL